MTFLEATLHINQRTTYFAKTLLPKNVRLAHLSRVEDSTKKQKNKGPQQQRQLLLCSPPKGGTLRPIPALNSKPCSKVMETLQIRGRGATRRENTLVGEQRGAALLYSSSSSQHSDGPRLRAPAVPCSSVSPAKPGVLIEAVDDEVGGQGGVLVVDDHFVVVQPGRRHLD